MAYCRVLLCNTNKKLSCCNGGFLFIFNKHLVTFHFPLAIYHLYIVICICNEQMYLSIRQRLEEMGANYVYNLRG